MKKRVFAVLTATILLCACLPLGAVSVSAEVKQYGELNYSVIDGEVAITTSSKATGKVVIPEKIDGKPVTKIQPYAFAHSTGITTVEIPDTVTYIGGEAFVGTDFYTDKSNWKDDVLYIGNHLIAADPDISGKYTIKRGTITIADEAFQKCEKLTAVTIPNSVKTIGRSAFSGCTDLQTVKMGKGITSIWGSAFRDCESLTEITIPDSVTTIGEDAFFRCTALKTATIGGENPIVGASIFQGCTALESVVIRDGVTTLSIYMFGDCKNLSYVVIPFSLRTINNGAFHGCNSLSKVYYRGERSEWDRVTIEKENDPIYDAVWYDKTYLPPYLRTRLIVGVSVAVGVSAVAALVLILLLKKKKKAKQAEQE